MYVPRHFRVEDREEALRFVEAHSFGALATSTEGLPKITHMPMLLNEDRNEIIGHVAKVNDHWKWFGRPSTAIFTGPHAHISTRWYEAHPSVATWNFTAVHLHGIPKPIEDERVLIAFLQRLTLYYDPEIATLHPEDLEEAFVRRHAQGVVGFTMQIEGIDAKYKLSQNKDETDRQRVIDEVPEDLAEMMKRVLR